MWKNMTKTNSSAKKIGLIQIRKKICLKKTFESFLLCNLKIPNITRYIRITVMFQTYNISCYAYLNIVQFYTKFNLIYYSKSIVIFKLT